MALKKKRGKVFVVSGPSGSGKTTLAQLVLKDRRFKRDIVKSISFTTRPKRAGEKDKRDYFFISEEDFRERLKAKKILEWTRYLGYYYGTAKEFVDSQLTLGRSIILCLDLKGAKSLKKLYPKDAVTIFVKPPSIGELPKRIKKRCSKTAAEEIKKRVALARHELAEARRYDFSLVNRDLEDAVGRLKTILAKFI